MLNRIKNIFKKSLDTTSSWIPFSGYHSSKKIRDNEYVSYFTSWQYAAITAISDSISSLNYRLADKNDQDITHEYMEFITPELLQNITVFMKLCGTAYLWKVSLNNKSLGLSVLLPRCLTPNIDSYGNLLSWTYYGNGSSLKLSVDEVLVFAEFNPYERYPYITRGYSPLQALAMAVKGEEEIAKWNYSLLTNDVPPGMILTTNEKLSPEQVKTVKDNWERNHTGALNVNKLAVLPFGIKPSSIQSSPREMEFISQQERDRDKILAIYKVPKAVLGIGEGVNVGNVKAFNQIYASRCIDPLAKKIARVFNDRLFKGIGTFEFLNVLPSDEDAVREHYLSGGITRNEYRMELGYKPIKGGDVFYDGEEAVIDVIKDNRNSLNTTSNTTSSTYGVNYKSIVNKHIKWSEEWMIERRNRKQITYKGYEDKLREGFLKIFDKQEKDILRSFEKEKESNRKISLSLKKKYYSLYHLILKYEIENLIRKEGSRAMKELDNDKEFKVNEHILKKIKQSLSKLAKEVDAVTDEKLLREIGKAINEGLSESEIKEVLQGVFKDLKTTRLDKIIRTESIRYGSYAEQKAWEQSGIVKYKQWWTAPDDRRCEECKSLHKVKVKLNEEFSKGIFLPPLHPNCRCDMIPSMY